MEDLKNNILTLIGEYKYIIDFQGQYTKEKVFQTRFYNNLESALEYSNSLYENIPDKSYSNLFKFDGAKRRIIENDHRRCDLWYSKKIYCYIDKIDIDYIMGNLKLGVFRGKGYSFIISVINYLDDYITIELLEIVYSFGKNQYKNHTGVIINLPTFTDFDTYYENSLIRDSDITVAIVVHDGKYLKHNIIQQPLVKSAVKI
jgi:hypothetical protein